MVDRRVLLDPLRASGVRARNFEVRRERNELKLVLLVSRAADEGACMSTDNLNGSFVRECVNGDLRPLCIGVRGSLVVLIRQRGLGHIDRLLHVVIFASSDLRGLPHALGVVHFHRGLSR